MILSPANPIEPEEDAPIDPGEDALIKRLLDGLNLPAAAPPGEYDHPMADLRTVLAADYREAPGFPSNSLTHELIRVVENLIAPYRHIWRCWQDRQNVHQMSKVFRWGDVVVNAQPYMQDTGLSLWGFSCAAKLDSRNKFVIYLNTAHDPGAVAATIGHELGHYVYNAIGGGTCAEQAAMGNIFAAHLAQEEELFSDAVVALSAYSYPRLKPILGPNSSGRGGPADAGFAGQMRAALSTIDPQYRIDLRSDNLTAAWRIRYLTLMIHFFKLRCALADAAGI
ncbi:MAG: ImmA/IrrE family metallo-endopeptidase [Candidatus Binatales bacterium]